MNGCTVADSWAENQFVTFFDEKITDTAAREKLQKKKTKTKTKYNINHFTRVVVVAKSGVGSVVMAIRQLSLISGFHEAECLRLDLFAVLIRSLKIFHDEDVWREFQLEDEKDE